MDIKEALQSATLIVRNKTEGIPTENPPSEVKVKKPEADDLMMSFFRIDNKDLNWDTAKKLNEIKDYVNDVSKKEGDVGMLNVLRDIKFKMGAPNLGVSPLENTYKYIKLRTEARQLDERAKAMEV